jgi:ABC-type nitrate/sulfonate/bicarbonate transport system substrate-binding protein
MFHHATPALGRRAFLSGLAASSLATLSGSRTASAQQMKATLAYGSTGYTWAVTFVAEALGTWKNAGVDLSVVDFPTGRESMQALLAGSAEFSASTDTPFIFAALQGLKPLILVNYSRYSRDMKIVVRKEGGIDPMAPASLKGKKIATRVGTSGQYMLAKYLEMAGVSIKDVTVIDMSPNDMTIATVRGDVDGFSWTSQAAVVADRQAPGKVAVMTQAGLEKYFQSHQLLLTSERVVREKPQLAAAAVKALFDAEARMASDPNWAALIAARVRTTPEEITSATKDFEFKIGFDERFIDDLVAQAEWAIAAGLSKKPEGDLRALLRSLVYDGPVKAVHPERVSI